MSTHYHAVVWIDHKQARVVYFNADSSEPQVVQSSHPNAHLHHKANSIDSGHAPVDKKFFERVAEAIAHAGAVLVVGPASAKTELVSYLKQAHPATAARISAVEPMDHPTDGQLLAHARHFFKADDRMRSQIHAQGHMALHEKMDALRTEQLAALLRQQREQIDLRVGLLARTGIAGKENA